MPEAVGGGLEGRKGLAHGCERSGAMVGDSRAIRCGPILVVSVDSELGGGLMHNPKAKKGLAGWSWSALVGAARIKRRELEALTQELVDIDSEMIRRIPAGKTIDGMHHRVRVVYRSDDTRLAQLGRLAEALSSQVDESKLAALARLCPELLDCRAIIKDRVSKLVVVSP